ISSMATVSGGRSSAGGGAGCVTGRVGNSAPSPLPSALRGFSVRFMVENLFGEPDIALRAAGARVVGNNGFAETRRLRQPYAARNHSVEHLFSEEFLQVGSDLAREDGSIVKHREEDPRDGNW